jgi:hypothetical protein
MIGANTLLVKRGNICEVYRFGGLTDTTGLTLEMVDEQIDSWIPVDGVPASEIDQIGFAHACIPDYGPNWHKYAGDQVFLIDRDDNMLWIRRRNQAGGYYWSIPQ